MDIHELEAPRTEVTVQELARRYGVTLPLVEEAIRDCINNYTHSKVMVEPGRYRITYEDAVRLRNYLQR